MTQSTQPAPSNELLFVANAIAEEKNIDKSHIFEAMEQALQKAGRSRYGQDLDIRVSIDRQNGAILLQRYIEIVSDQTEIEHPKQQISETSARQRNPECAVGEFLIEDLPPLDFGRIAAQTAKQVLVQHVREAERERQYHDFKDRVGEIITGVVKSIEYGNVIVDLGNAEGTIRRDQTIAREFFNRNDRVRCYITEVRRENRGPQIFLSRTHPQFMVKLFAQEVPEVYDGIIEIRDCARDPGSRAKISVYTSEPSIDPVGACVGMRGSRVQAVVGELQGEKIDIILWSQDIAAYVVNALAPAEVSKVIVDDELRRIEVVVPEAMLSKAIGRRGQNVRLASMLTSMEIDVMTEETEMEKRNREIMERATLFMEALDVDDVIARLLVTEGFGRVEEIALVPADQISAIEGFDEDLARELQLRAQHHLEQQEAKIAEQLAKYAIEEEMKNTSSLTPAMLLALAENDIRTMEDLAGTTPDELLSEKDGILRNFDLSNEFATELVMGARVQQKWISEEDKALALAQVQMEKEDSPQQAHADS